ncbi:lysM domain receptor-like kinase 3 [Quercus suber]|uniref:lysM domain receptor-like kinase 3 n=1 Tax=Quercus suber TaxID=58331 RepID=UPI0032DEB923
MKPEFGICFLVLVSLCYRVKASQCSQGCKVALATNFVLPVTSSDPAPVAKLFEISDLNVIQTHSTLNVILFQSFLRYNFPFSCDCIGGEFLGHVFHYTTRPNDTHDIVAKTNYANLTTPERLQKFNSYVSNKPLPSNSTLNVTVNFSCGNNSVSEDYGLFITYPLRP